MILLLVGWRDRARKKRRPYYHPPFFENGTQDGFPCGDTFRASSTSLIWSRPPFARKMIHTSGGLHPSAQGLTNVVGRRTSRLRESSVNQFLVYFYLNGRSLSVTVGAWSSLAAAQAVEQMYPGCQVTSTTVLR